MVESWNDGFKENKTQSTTYPVFQSSTIPSFHAAYQDNNRNKYRYSNKL
jgi:hypothetical protein